MVAFIITLTIALILSLASDSYFRSMDASRHVTALYGLLSGAGWAFIVAGAFFLFVLPEIDPPMELLK